MKKTLLRLVFVALPMFGFAQTYFSDNFDDEDLPETEDPYDFSLASEEGIKFFDEKLDKSQKQEITALIENAIEMNIDEFTCDW